MEQLELFDDTVSLVNEIQKLKTKILNYQMELASKSEHLREICKHPEEQIEDIIHNVSGTYLDYGYSLQWRRCKICGTESEKVRESDGCYG